jgi:hypothetical protein
MGDPGVIPVGEVAMGNLVGAAFVGDPLGEAVVFKTVPAPASKPFNGSVVGRLDMYRTKVLLYHTMVLLARPTKVRR